MEQLLIVELVTDDGVSAIAVLDWDEIENGEIETLLGSAFFQDAVGIKFNPPAGVDDETARLAGARTCFRCRDANERERGGWEASIAKFVEETGERPPVCIWNPRILAH